MSQSAEKVEFDTSRWLEALASRREVLLKLGWGGIVAFVFGSIVSTCRLFFPRTLFEPPSRFKVGWPEEFQPGTVNTQFQEKYRVWIVRREDRTFFAIKAECTHLGCTPNWLDSQKKFKCPCHGSGFRSSGVNFEGPAPRPLDRVKISLAADGQLVVDKSIVYRGIAGENPDELYPQSLLTV